nr:ribbon-helix-helix domain-containing protein [Paracoccus sp. (in: a-proteobacteria)]
MSAPRKRSVTIEGHATSVSLEDAFWRALDQQARLMGLTRACLIGRIDRARPPEVGLATALRLFVLAQVQAGPAQPEAATEAASSSQHASA